MFHFPTACAVGLYSCAAPRLKQLAEARTTSLFFDIPSLRLPSRPKCPVQRPVLNSFGDVLRFNLRRTLEVGNRARDFQDAVVGAGGETLLVHGAFEQPFAIGRKLAKSANVT